MPGLGFRQVGSTAIVLSALVLSLPGCSFVGNGGGDDEAAAISAAKSQVARAESAAFQLKDENHQLKLAKLEADNLRLQESSAKEQEHQQALESLKRENRQLSDQLADLQGQVEESELQLAIAQQALEISLPEVADKPDGSPSSNQEDVAVVFQLKPLPLIVKDDGSVCEECEKNRLVKCENTKCMAGFVPRKIKRFQKRFPCPICLGLRTLPCGSCRKGAYDHTLGQSTVIQGFLKQGRVVWIEFLGLRRELLLANAVLNRKSSGSSDSAQRAAEGRRRAAEQRIKEVTPKLEVVLKKNLEIQHAIVAVFKQQLELCVRGTPKSQRSALRDRGRRALEGFVKLYNLGYYY